MEKVFHVTRPRIVTCFMAGIVIVLTCISILRLYGYGFISLSEARLELTQREIDLGNGKPNEVLHGKMRLQNKGGRPLKFLIERSCGCTELTPTEGTVLPGTDCEIRIGIRLPSHLNSERTVRITVKTNDPEQPHVDCSAVARCAGPFSFEPSFVNFGERSTADTREAVEVIHLKSISEHVQLANDLLKIEQEGEFFTYTNDETSAGMCIRISLVPTLGIGRYHGSLKLAIQASDQFVHIPITASIVDTVTVIPSVVFLRRNDLNAGYDPVSVIMKSHTTTAIFELVKLQDAPIGVAVQKIDRIADGVCRIVLSVAADVKLVDKSTEIRFKCGDESKMISLKLVEANPR